MAGRSDYYVLPQGQIIKIKLTGEIPNIFLLAGISKRNILCGKKKKKLVVCSNIHDKFFSLNLTFTLKIYFQKSGHKKIDIRLFSTVQIYFQESWRSILCLWALPYRKCGGIYKQQTLLNSSTRKVDQKVLQETFLRTLGR